MQRFDNDLAEFLHSEMEPDETLGLYLDDEEVHSLYKNNQRTGGYILQEGTDGVVFLFLKTNNSDELNSEWNQLRLEHERKAS